MPPRGSYPTRFPHNTINALNRLNHRDCFVIACFSSCKRTTYAARRKIRDENNRKTKSATILGSLKILSSFFFLYFSNKKRIYTYNTIFPVYRTRVKSKSETLTFPLSLFHSPLAPPRFRASCPFNVQRHAARHPARTNGFLLPGDPVASFPQ